MRISFDVDDTLVVYRTDALTETVVPWWWRWRYGEPLRFGTRELMQSLSACGHELCIYTTSHRPPSYLRGWFQSIGVRLFDAINQDEHERAVKNVQFRGYAPTKFPPAFGIDLHVDDSEGVAIEGRTHGFRVVVVSPQDRDWTTRVLRAVEEIERTKKSAG